MLILQTKLKQPVHAIELVEFKTELIIAVGDESGVLTLQKLDPDPTKIHNAYGKGFFNYKIDLPNIVILF